MGDGSQSYARIRVHVALEECAQKVIHAPVREQGPELPGVAAETQAFTLLFAQLRKNGVDADDIRIETIDSRGVNQARGQPAKMPVDPAAEMIGGKPPKVTQKMGPWRDEHAMPDDLREVYVVSHAFAIKMNFVGAGQPFKLLGDAPFGSVTLIEDR